MTEKNKNSQFVEILFDNKKLFDSLGFSLDTLQSKYYERHDLYAAHKIVNHDKTEEIIIEQNAYGIPCNANIGMAFDEKYSDDYKYTRFCTILKSLFNVNFEIPDIFINSFVDTLDKTGIFKKSENHQPICLFNHIIEHGLDATCIINKSNIKLDTVNSLNSFNKRYRMKKLKFNIEFLVNIGGPAGYSWFSSKLKIIFKLGGSYIAIDTDLTNSMSFFVSIVGITHDNSHHCVEEVDLEKLYEKTEFFAYKLMSAYLNQPIADLKDIDDEKLDMMFTLKEMEKI